jgi:type IV secretion system protein VirB9
MTGSVLLVLWALPAILSAEVSASRSQGSRMEYFAFSYQAGAASKVDASSALGVSSSYRLSGEMSLRPARIGDDGIHMYIEWSEEQALPAVFALNALGDEEMVDGYMRQGVFTIDRVYPALVFRIGKKRAKAMRVSR